MRKKIRAPMTDHAETLILCKLEKWRVESGANPVDILNESIEKSWRGVFLNGHAKAVEATKTDQIKETCSSCGKSLDAGFKHSRKGRLCHEC